MSEVQPSMYLNLLESGHFSDFVIECQGIEFKVHRAIICLQSTMLNTAASGPFKEAEAQRITLNEEDPNVLSRVILFLYTGDYDARSIPQFFEACAPPSEYHTAPIIPEGVFLGEIEVFELKVHALVYKYADMTGVDTLKTLASTRFLDTAKQYAYDGYHGLAETLRLVYESTSSDDTHLRIPVTQMCVLDYEDVIEQPEILAVILEHEANAWNTAVPLLRDAEDAMFPARLRAMERAIFVVNNTNHCYNHANTRLEADAKYEIDEYGTIRAYCPFCL